MASPRRPTVLAAIAIGGALGAPARYGVAQVVHASPGSFPWATFWTNVSGSFVLGVAVLVLATRFPAAQHVRAFVAVGFLGAYTTFSTFVVDADVLVKDGHAAVATWYVLGSLVSGLAAAAAGMAFGRWAAGR